MADDKFAYNPSRRAFIRQAGAAVARAGLRSVPGDKATIGPTKEALSKNWRGADTKIAGHHVDVYHHFNELGSNTEGHGPGWFWTKFEKGGLSYGKRHGPFSGPSEALKHASDLAKDVADFEE